MTTAETTAPQNNESNLEAAAQAQTAVREVLRGGVEYIIDPSVPLAHDEKYGCDVIAVVTTDRDKKAGEVYEDGTAPDSFMVLDLRKLPISAVVKDKSYKAFGDRSINSRVQFMIVGKEYRGANKGSKGIQYGETVNMGRTSEETKNRFDFSDQVSRNHFSLKSDVNGKLTIIDHDSTNGVGIVTGAPVQEKPSVQSEAAASLSQEPGIIDAIPSFAKPAEAPAASEAQALPKSARQHVEELTKGLSETDINALRGYSNAMQYRRISQKEGNAQDARYWYENANLHFSDLSAEAKKRQSSFTYFYDRM